MMMFGSALKSPFNIASVGLVRFVVLPWRSRKPMEDAVKAYMASSPTPLVDWKFRERVTAVRAATILSDDVAGATALLLQVQMDLAVEEGTEPPSEELSASVLGFSVSDTAMQLRRRLNLLMKA